MKSIIFYFLILIVNLNILSASDKWDFSLLKTDNTEHKDLVTTLYESLNKLERTEDLNTSLTNISSAIGNLENTQFIEFKGNFYKSAINQVKKEKQTLAKLKQDYLDELKEKCHTFLNPEPQKKELQQSEQIESDLKDTWDFSQMKESKYNGKREELEQLVAKPLNKGDEETVLNDQFKTIAKLIQVLNITGCGSYSFWNNQKNPNNLNLINKSIASLAKKLKKKEPSGKALSSSDSVITENPPVIETNSSVIDESLDVQKIVTKTTNPQSNNENDRQLKTTDNVNLDNTKDLTASDCAPQNSKKLNTLAIIAQISNSLEEELWTLKQKSNLQINNLNLDIKVFIITLLDKLNTLQQVIFILKNDSHQDKLETIKSEISTIQTRCQKPLPTEINDLKNLVNSNFVPTIKNKIIAPLKNLCEELPSVPASIKDENPVTFNSNEKNFEETVLNQIKNTDDVSLEIKTFSNLSNISEQNERSTGKNQNPKPNKSTWLKPKIIFGVALFSITVYWFLKNYLFGKNPA